MGIKRKSKNVYKKSPAGKNPFRYTGALLKVFFAVCLYIGISAILVFGYDLAVHWNVFNLKTITVKGNTSVSDQQVISDSELEGGENILSMNLSAAKKRLALHPMIAAVDIKRDFPSGITIRIREHSPVAVLDMGRQFTMNATGEILMETTASDTPALPVIFGFGPSDINAAGKLHGVSFEEVMELLHLGSRPNSILPVERMKRIYMDKHTGLTVETEGRIQTIRLGYGNFVKKVERLKTIYSFLNNRPDLNNFISIDVMNINRIVLKSSRIG